MQIDEYLELVKKRRNIRGFKPDPIPDGYVEKILEAARWAMSGANGQPWEFIVVKDRETKNKMAEQYVEVRKRIYHVERTRVEELRQPMFVAPPKGVPYFHQAPVIIVIVTDRRTYQATVLSTHFLPDGEGGADATYYKGIANATQNIHMAAAALELGSSWFSVSGLWDPPLKQLLGVPMEFNIPTIVPIGYPAYEASPTYRRELKEIMHYERYDSSKYRTDDDIYNFIVDLRRRSRVHYDLSAKKG